MLKWWIKEINFIIEDYLDTGKVIISEGWRPSEAWTGGFYTFVIYMLMMTIILPFIIILDILRIPLFIIGKLIIFVYKIIKNLGGENND